MDALRAAYSAEGTSSSGSESQEWKLQAQAAKAVSRENDAACSGSVCDTATSVHRHSRKRFRYDLSPQPSSASQTEALPFANDVNQVQSTKLLIPEYARFPTFLETTPFTSTSQLLRACRQMPGLHPMDAELPALPLSPPAAPFPPAAPSPPATPDVTAASTASAAPSPPAAPGLSPTGTAAPTGSAASAAAAAGPSSQTSSRVPPQRETCARLALSRLLAAPLHCSLSRTVPLRLPQIGPLVALLRRNLQPQKRWAAHRGRRGRALEGDLEAEAGQAKYFIKAFSRAGQRSLQCVQQHSPAAPVPPGCRFLLRLSRWSPFANDEGTRSFLALEATDEGVQEFCEAVSAVNRAFLLHQLPQYYEPPRPHASLLWALGDRRAALAAVAAALHSAAGETGGEQRLRVEVAAVVCRAGKRVFSVWEGQ